MSVNEKEPPPYNIPVEGQGDNGVKVYHVHTPFNPPSSTIPSNNYYVSQSQGKPVYTSGGGGIGGGGETPTQKFVSYDTELGRSEGMTTCTSCQQQVMTNVTYKVGAFAWLSCILFILCGLVVGCCLIPFFLKHFKDVYHSCPRCNRIIHVEKPSCCYRHTTTRH
ncbi:lipopolysaccharide-induced tumor necrosis factor-alpha factor homolog-like [Salvelinus fontinalis]|uniref:lipopolysaccharide-induced tumor necrosis factor-alpha factor homolog-like n=1 Tax=Salvelinus fontinalis TaxID=8038 RepID=UPI002485E21A|nr:lipopolysaccharide-induced tumor necrosis factor-alpha factor homolog-like [Salvelinus fontinalis]